MNHFIKIPTESDEVVFNSNKTVATFDSINILKNMENTITY